MQFANNKLMSLLVGLVLIITLRNIYADTGNIDPVVEYSGIATIPNNATSPLALNAPINITIDDSSDLVNGTTITITPPNGLNIEFVGTPEILLTGISGTATGTLTLKSIGSSITQTANVSGVNNFAIPSDYIKDGEIKFEIDSLTMGNNTLVLSIGSSGSTNNFIGLKPTNTTATDNINTTGLQLTINLNGNTTTNVGTINILAKPSIVSATLVDSVTADVVFNVGVGSSSANANNFSFSELADGSSGVTATNVSIPDVNDNKILRLVSNTSINFDKSPTISITNNSIHNIDETVTIQMGNTNTKPFPIKKSNAIITSIDISKNTVGTRKKAGRNSFDSNIFSTTVNLNIARQPFKIKFMNTSDSSLNPSPLDTGDKVNTNISKGLAAKVLGLDITREDTNHNDNDDFNFDVFVVEGNKNTANSVVIDFVLGAEEDAFIKQGEFDGLNPDNVVASAIEIGSEENIRVIASLDDFLTIVTSDIIKVDKKGPNLITSGTATPTAESLVQIKLNFDEKLNSLTATNINNWRVGKGADLEKHTISDVILDANQTAITLNTNSLFTEGADDINISVRKFGTPTIDVEDIYHNPIFGTTTEPFNNNNFSVIGTVTAPIVTMDTFITSLPKAGYESVSNINNLINFTILSRSGLSASDIYLQVFDATVGFGIPMSFKFDGTSLGNQTGGVNITESESGKYEGSIKLFDNLTSSSIKIWALISATVPTTESDWADKLESNVFEVDNTPPTVLQDAEYQPDTNRIIVKFNEGMNIVELEKRDNFPEIINLTSGGTISILDMTVLEKDSAIYTLLRELSSSDTYVIDFDEKTIDDAGNPISDVNEVGIDRAELVFNIIATPEPTLVPTSTLDPSTTPTPFATPTPTPIPTPTPQPTPTAKPPLVADFRANTVSGEAPFTVQFLSLHSGEPTDWIWEFGDGGVSKEQDPQHIYKTPGSFTVKLTILDVPQFATETKRNFIRVTGPDRPIANFTMSTTNGTVPFDVNFQDESEPSNKIDQRLWDFGDGQTSAKLNPSHTYNNNGIFRVTLTVSNISGEDTATKQITASLPPKPTALFVAVTETRGSAPFSVRFQDLSEPVGKIDSWLWIFGDGNLSIEQNPTHRYTRRGFYSVELFVTNRSGSSSMLKKRMIRVKR